MPTLSARPLTAAERLSLAPAPLWRSIRGHIRFRLLLAGLVIGLSSLLWIPAAVITGVVSGWWAGLLVAVGTVAFIVVLCLTVSAMGVIPAWGRRRQRWRELGRGFVRRSTSTLDAAWVAIGPGELGSLYLLRVGPSRLLCILSRHLPGSPRRELATTVHIDRLDEKGQVIAAVEFEGPPCPIMDAPAAAAMEAWKAGPSTGHELDLEQPKFVELRRLVAAAPDAA